MVTGTVGVVIEAGGVAIEAGGVFIWAGGVAPTKTCAFPSIGERRVWGPGNAISWDGHNRDSSPVPTAMRLV